jgi:hypothetical protein
VTTNPAAHRGRRRGDADLVAEADRAPACGETDEAPRFEMGRDGKGAVQGAAAHAHVRARSTSLR